MKFNNKTKVVDVVKRQKGCVHGNIIGRKTFKMNRCISDEWIEIRIKILSNGI